METFPVIGNGPFGQLELAQSGNEFIRNLRLPSATSQEVVWFFVILVGGALVAYVLLYAYNNLKGRPRTSRKDDHDFEALLEELGIRGELLDVLESVAALAQAPAVECIKTVETFDLGVERLLARAGMQNSRERLELLRNLRTLRRKLDFDQVGSRQPMRSTRCLAVDQEMVLSYKAKGGDGVVAGGDRGGGEEFYAATVFHSDEEGILLRLLPLLQQPLKKPFVGKPGMKVRMHFFRPNEGAYTFETSVVEFRPRGPGFVRLRHAKSLRRRQRRNYYRVDMSEHAIFRWFPKKTTTERRLLYGDLAEIFRDYNGTALNLSGGGMKLAVDDMDLQLDDWVEVRLPFLPDSLGQLGCFARIVQIYRSPPHGEFGLEFESPPARLVVAILRDVDERCQRVGGPVDKYDEGRVPSEEEALVTE